MATRWVVWDTEGDGLNPTKFYCLSYHDYEGKKGTLTDYEDIRGFFEPYDCYVAHNCRRWDLRHLERVVGITVPDYVVDTLFVAWYISPERKKNGLEEYGEDYGVPKPKIVDWETQSLSDYIHRCEQDVEINYLLWQDQLSKLFDLYEDGPSVHRFLKYLDFKARSAALAEDSRWKLDIPRCQEAIERLEYERGEKERVLDAALPPVPVVRSYERPKVFYKRDGQLSESGLRWIERARRGGFPDDYEGTITEVVSYDAGNSGSTQQIKAWLDSLGWRPRTIKHVRHKVTGEKKEIPQINKPPQEGGGVCESVLELAEQHPDHAEAIHALDGFTTLQHRLGILRGFLRDVDDEGYLTAKVAGLTNTLRFKHAGLVNLPKPDRPYASDIRACLIADDGHELCGSDQSSLEDRLKQHYLYRYDPEYVNQLMDPKYDPHLDIAVIARMMKQEEADAYKEGDKSNKPIRDIAKNGNYACQYGAMPPRLQITCGISAKAAQELYDAYWEKNWAIKQVAEDQETKESGGHTWMYNPLSGFWYQLRSKKDRFSTLIQGSGVYCFDLWVREVLRQRPQITAQFHDEIVLQVKKGHREDMKEVLERALDKTNEMLQLNRELGISVDFGDTYAEIH